MRLRVGEDLVFSPCRLLDDEGKTRLSDRVGVEKTGDGADVEVDCRDADELPVLVVDGGGVGDARDGLVAAAERSPLGPDRASGIAGRLVPAGLPSLAGHLELPPFIRLSLRVVFGPEVEDLRLAGLAVVACLPDAEPAVLQALDGQHQAALETRRKKGEMALRLQHPLQVTGEPVQRLRPELDGAEELAVHLALVLGAGEQRADPVPDAQGALVEHLPGEGVGVSLEVVVGKAPEEGDGAEDHHHEKGRERRAEGDAGRGRAFLRRGFSWWYCNTNRSAMLSEK